MSEILVKRVQYPVGQGGFHMVDILVAGRPFRYIYDCGTRTGGTIAAVLANLHRTPSEKKFDWLVISSFDMDHFHGVRLLLKHGYTFKKVFLPHALDKDLLVWLLCCYFLARRSPLAIRTAFANLHALYHAKLAPPRETKDDTGSAALEPALTPDNGPPGVPGSVYYMHQTDWMFRFYSLDTNVAELVAAIFAGPDLARLKTLMETAANTLTGNANLAVKPTLFTDIYKELRRVPAPLPSPAMPPPPSTVSAQSGSATGAVSGGKALSVKKILDAAFKSIKSKNERVFHDYNAASLCLYSGPRTTLDPSYTRFTVECTVGSRSPHATRNLTRRVGWLATGDMGFPNRRLLDQFTLYYGAELALSCTKMVPHHGAEASYGKDLAMLQPFYWLDRDRPLWVAAASPKASYRHPRDSVVAQCWRHGTFALVSEVPSSRLEETIRSEPTESSLTYLTDLLRYKLGT